MNRKKGYTLAAVLAVATLLTISATLLWNDTTTDQQISANSYKVTQARSAAHSGMSHFISLHLSDQDIQERLVVPETVLTSKTSYEVEAVWVDESHLLVVSKGKYKKAGETVFEYPMKAIFTPTAQQEQQEE